MIVAQGLIGIARASSESAWHQLSHRSRRSFVALHRQFPSNTCTQLMSAGPELGTSLQAQGLTHAINDNVWPSCLIPHHVDPCWDECESVADTAHDYILEQCTVLNKGRFIAAVCMSVFNALDLRRCGNALRMHATVLMKPTPTVGGCLGVEQTTRDGTGRSCRLTLELDGILTAFMIGASIGVNRLVRVTGERRRRQVI
ncbi:hypothetical protein KC324_g24 [Hortaea werneckii]|nr:hypothetical protein KC324_g24 [Hortaea werneckii]